MMTDLNFVHYRNYRFDGFLFVRVTGIDLGKVKSITYTLHQTDGGHRQQLDSRVVRSQADSRNLDDYGCPITFQVQGTSGSFSITPTVTWLASAGGGNQVFPPLVFTIQPGESTRSILDKVPVDQSAGRRKREAEPARTAGKVPAAFALHDGVLQGSPEINDRPPIGPLIVKFGPGGRERLAADMLPASASRLVALWPVIANVITLHPFVDPNLQDPGDNRPEVLAPYWRIEQPTSMFNDTFIELAKTLAALDYVEGVHFQPPSEDDPNLLAAGAAAVVATLFTGGVVYLGQRANDNAQRTPDFEVLQTYLDEPGPAHKGLNIRKAWEKDVKGQGVRVHLTDGGLYPDHEDLRDSPLIRVVVPGSNDDPLHGTLSSGVMVATANGFGVTGICHAAELYLYHNRAGAATQSALLRRVIPGDVVVFNREITDPSVPGTRLPTLHAPSWWDVMDALVARGAVVVCAAGNGHRESNHKVGAVQGYGLDMGSWQYFDNHGDAGAIVVGACDSWDGKPAVFSNYGYPYRMLNAWGDSVVTTGAIKDKDLQVRPGTNRDYTDFYNGTSSATPIVGGALSLIQSYAMEQHHVYLNSDQMHLLVMASGYQDATLPFRETLPMGARPNVEGALNLLDRILGGGRFFRQ